MKSKEITTTTKPIVNNNNNKNHSWNCKTALRSPGELRELERES